MSHTSLEAQYDKIIHSIEQGQFEAAIAALRHLIEKHPEQAHSYHLLGLVFIELKQYQQGIELIKYAIGLNDQDPAFFTNLSLALLQVEQINKAVQAAAQAVALDSQFANGHYILGNALRRQGRHKDAIDSYKKALSIDDQLLDAWVNMGNNLHIIGEMDEAITAYQAAARIDPKSLTALNNLGNVLQAAERYEQALAVYDQALALKPDLMGAYTNKAVCLKAMGAIDQGIDTLLSAEQKNPHYAETYYLLGVFYLEKNQCLKAMEACKQCLNIHPLHMKALALKALLFYQLGQVSSGQYLVDLHKLLKSATFSVPPGYRDMREFNQALAQHIVQHKSLMYQPTGKATRFGQQTGNLLVPPKGPIADLEQLMRPAINNYIHTLPTRDDHPFLKHRYPQWRLALQGVILNSQGHQLPHIHPSSWISGVYYVQLPESNILNDEKHSGWIQFGLPPEDISIKKPPNTRLVRPQEGQLLMFPAYFYHNTIAFDSQTPRISIAFDIVPEQSLT